MAEVTEVIHKISYEVNDEQLRNATNQVQQQIAELNKLKTALNDYTVQLKSLSAGEVQQLDELARKIDATSKLIIRSVGQTEGLLKQSFKGVLKGLDIETDAKDAIAKYVAGVKSKFDELSRSTKAVTSGVNNMFTSTSTAAAKGSAKTSSAIGKLGKSLLSTTGLIDLGITALALLAEEMYSVDGALNGLNATELNAIKIHERVLELYTDNKVQLELYNREVLNEETSLTRLKKIRDELAGSYPGLKGNLEGEANLRVRLADSIGKVNQALVLNARVTAAKELLAENERKFLSKDLTYWEQFKKVFLDTALPGTGMAEVIRGRTKEYTETKDSLLKVIDETNKELQETGLYQITENDTTGDSNSTKTYTTPISKPAPIPKPDFKKALATGSEDELIAEGEQAAKSIADRQASSYEEALEERIKEIDLGAKLAQIMIEEQYQNDEIDFATYEDRKAQYHYDAQQEKLKAEEETYAKIAGIRDLDVEKAKEAEDKKLSAQNERLTNSNAKKSQAKPKDQQEEQKGLTEKQKENIQNGIDGYEQLAQAAADAYNKILQAQIDTLDAEIAVRERRVEKAKELAERGNTDALRLEEERLQKAQEKRAQFAKRQQAVNAAITVSNAIAAVARAALEGGGFGSVATIAALIAALAAGYAAVTSLSSGGDSFADGVVDYRGKGGPRDDKNWVRISNGESVITAEGTRKNRALLEAINQGAALHMIDPALPIMLPAFKQPQINNGNGYAAAKDMKVLEAKLDDVVNAIADNKFRQDVFFNEQGVGMMTERAIAKDRKRWK